MATNYNLEISLKRMALIQVAVNFWEQPCIKNEIKIFFSKHDSYTILRSEQDKKIDWNRVLYNQLQKMKLPDTIKNELMFVITAVGDRRFEWFKYMSHKLENEKHQYPAISHYLDNVSLTNIGTIDGVKVFESLFNNETRGTDTIDMPYMYEEACNYCLENYIENIWHKCSNEDKEALSWKTRWNIGDGYNVHLLVYWRWYISDRTSHLFIQSTSPNNYDELYDFNHSAKENTFRLSVLGGYDVAVKYFFNQLNEDEKNRNLIEATEMVLNEKILELSDSSDDDCNKQYIDILVFLIQQMTDEKRLDFLRKYKLKILNILLINWPWQYLFLQTLDLLWEFFTDYDYVNLFKSIVESILDEYEFRDITESTNIQMLYETWYRSPIRLKHSIVKDCWTTFDKLMRVVRDTCFLKSLINDDDMKLLRQELLEGGKDCYFYLIIEKKVRVLEKFMETVLYNDEERLLFKNNLDDARVCEHFILKSQYHLVEKFLEWRFSDKEDRILFKNNLKKDEKCGSILSDIWRLNESGIERIKWETKNYFKWFSFSEFDMNNLKRQLNTNQKFKRTIKKFLKEGRGDQFTNFLQSCEFSASEMHDLKMELRNEIEAEQITEAQNQREIRNRLSFRLRNRFRVPRPLNDDIEN